MKVINEKFLNEVSEQAKASPRLRMNYDLRTQASDSVPDWKDSSQRMLNVMMKDTVIPIHRHTETSETVIVLRGSGDEVTYDDDGHELERVTHLQLVQFIESAIKGFAAYRGCQAGCNYAEAFEVVLRRL